MKPNLSNAEPAGPDPIERVNQWLADELPGLLGRHRRQPGFRPLVDEIVDLTCRSGKRIRPRLFLRGHALFADPESAAIDSRDLIPAAAALEILHAFILVHDDLIDKSDTRRGLPSLHRGLEKHLTESEEAAEMGQHLAIVAGDVLFASAQLALLRSGLPSQTKERMMRYLAGNLVDTGWGEAADIVYGDRDISRIGALEIAEMYWLKTTRYTIEGPLWLGGLAAGMDESDLMPLSAIARPLGLAFQIANDLGEFKRAAGSGRSCDDLDCRKKTLLVLEAFKCLKSTEQAMLQLALSSDRRSKSTGAVICDLITRSGAVDELNQRQQDLMEEARSAIESAPYPRRRRQGLHQLVDDVTSIVGA